ncbi:hypothetical protein SRABI106_00407 [Rahnella aquatilis]|nr:hypothetical protein SRABI106_00407 [Rahnella aquatilis]
MRDEIRQKFKQLCNDEDFISAYNDFNGTALSVLTEAQLMSTGTLFNIVDIKMKDGAELNLTDGFFDVSHEGKIYLATGDFLDIASTSEEKEINNKGLNVKVSNVRPEYIELIRAKRFGKANVDIRLAFMNPNKGTVANTFPVFSGAVDSININVEIKDDESTNESEIALNSLWEVLDKSARQHASDGVHRSYAGNENDGFFSRIGAWNSEHIWKTKQ